MAPVAGPPPELQFGGVWRGGPCMHACRLLTLYLIMCMGIWVWRLGSYPIRAQDHSPFHTIPSVHEACLHWRLFVQLVRTWKHPIQPSSLLHSTCTCQASLEAVRLGGDSDRLLLAGSGKAGVVLPGLDQVLYPGCYWLYVLAACL